ncbi:hypothetical protein Aperf_G00000132036 [Anoplocephala perfoliata]
MRLLARTHFTLLLYLLLHAAPSSADEMTGTTSYTTTNTAPHTSSYAPLTTATTELDASTTDDSIPFFTFLTTPMVTLNGEEFSPIVVPITDKESKNFHYLTDESPPTTPQTDPPTKVPRMTTAKANSEEVAISMSVKPEVETTPKLENAMSPSVVMKPPTEPVPQTADEPRVTTSAGGLTAIVSPELTVAPMVNVGEVTTTAKSDPAFEVTQPELSSVVTSSTLQITEMTQSSAVKISSGGVTPLTPPSMSEANGTTIENKLATKESTTAVESSEVIAVLTTSQVEITTLEWQTLLSSTATPVTEKADSVESADISTTTSKTTPGSHISTQTTSVGSITMTPETTRLSSTTQEEPRTTLKSAEITSEEETTNRINTVTSILTESSQAMPPIASPLPDISSSTQSIVSMRATPVVTIPEVQMTTSAESKKSETSMLQTTEGVSFTSVKSTSGVTDKYSTTTVPPSAVIPTESPVQITSYARTEQMSAEDEITGVSKVEVAVTSSTSAGAASATDFSTTKSTPTTFASGTVVTSSAQSAESIQAIVLTSPTTKPPKFESTGTVTTQLSEVLTSTTTSTAEQMTGAFPTVTKIISTERLVETIVPTEIPTSVSSVSSESASVVAGSTTLVPTKHPIPPLPSSTPPDGSTTETHSSSAISLNTLNTTSPPTIEPPHITPVVETKMPIVDAETEEWRRKPSSPLDSDVSATPLTSISTTTITGTVLADIAATSETPTIEGTLTVPRSDEGIEMPQQTSTLSQRSIPTRRTPIQPAVTEKAPAGTLKPAVDANTQEPKEADLEGMTLATAVSMGLILIFLLILLCILAVSLIAGWIHCRGRDSRRPKVSLIRVERGLATELADSWSRGTSAQAWMTTQSGAAAAAAMSTHRSSSSPQAPTSQGGHAPPPPAPSFQCGCKRRRGPFRRGNRLCMVHGDASARHGGGAVRAVKIISLSDESDGEEAEAVLLTELNRRRASGASNTADEEEERRRNVESESGKRCSEWLFIDEA